MPGIRALYDSNVITGSRVTCWSRCGQIPSVAGLNHRLSSSRATRRSRHGPIPYRNSLRPRYISTPCNCAVAPRTDTVAQQHQSTPISTPCNRAVTPQADSTPQSSALTHNRRRMQPGSRTAGEYHSRQQPRSPPSESIYPLCNWAITQRAHSAMHLPSSRINPEHVRSRKLVTNQLHRHCTCIPATP